MSIQVDKLIEHTNQLAIWLRENPRTAIPTVEKNRLRAILTKIIEQEEISDLDWVKVKPVKALNNQVDNPNLFNRIRSSLSKKVKNKQTPQTNLNPIIITDVVIKNGKPMFKCGKCGDYVLVKNTDRHRNRCVANQSAGTSKYTKKSSTLIIKENDNPFVKERKIEKGLDGSDGFHVFRNQGRFGDYPSFDNMSDEAHP
jgi:hypothetical protein